MSRVASHEVAWRLGRSESPAAGELWVRYDRTTGVYGAQGSGKTLDLLAPALLAHPGAAMVTLTKVDDLLLTVTGRRACEERASDQAGDRAGDAAGIGGRERPVAVLDPFGAAPGLPPLLWDPVAGCADPMTAERRAKAFAAGTVAGSNAGGRVDNAARFYAAETAKVLQGFLHAAALTGRTLDDVMRWVANPAATNVPLKVLGQHPHAAPHWEGLLAGALYGAPETASNTITTVQQAMTLFFQPAIRARCTPTGTHRATDLAALIAAGGTIYLLGREDPYASASPLLTAVTEHILDTALAAAGRSVHGRLCPPFLACLDELPSTAPIPTLRVRMANERALGLTFLYAAQTWRQMVVAYGEDEARALLGLTNNLVIFGGGKDIQFYKEMSELIGTTRVTRRSVSDGPGGIGTNRSGEDTPVLRPEQLRLLPERRVLVLADNAPPIIARLTRCLDGRAGRRLAADLAHARANLAAARAGNADGCRSASDTVEPATQAARLRASTGRPR
ncbi:MAG: type IV secretory system conjugative DNA transfer family protein [Jatrophihabitans sp.]|uniref:type IV secretory system conjugative DNA transfer family protein n=1 Tax=Jatrophihabitans sp. TaxID=1932789 RepID=UPI003F806166